MLFSRRSSGIRRGHGVQDARHLFEHRSRRGCRRGGSPRKRDRDASLHRAFRRGILHRFILAQCSRRRRIHGSVSDAAICSRHTQGCGIFIRYDACRPDKPGRCRSDNAGLRHGRDGRGFPRLGGKSLVRTCSSERRAHEISRHDEKHQSAFRVVQRAACKPLSSRGSRFGGKHA